MKSSGLALFGAVLACAASTAAQATVFTFDVIYWEGDSDAPPADPAADQTAHFQIDDTAGARTPPSSHYQSIRFDTSGQFFGFTGDAIVDLDPISAFGGLDMIPDSDFDNLRGLGGDAVVGDDLDSPQISTGVFYMGDYGERTGTYQVTISEAGASAAPEPVSWALMLCGFGAIGGAMRSRKKAAGRFA